MNLQHLCSFGAIVLIALGTACCDAEDPAEDFLLETPPTALEPEAPTTPQCHDYVDLCLPSGTLWATCNIGASKPEESGLFFAWGETRGYTSDDNEKLPFDWVNYKWCNGSEKTMTKYCTNSRYGNVDNLSLLEPADDAAHVAWGDQWRMPTNNDFRELLKYTDHIWLNLENAKGFLFTSHINGNALFLPATGHRISDLYCDDNSIHYWASTLFNQDQSHASCLYLFIRLGMEYSNDYDKRIYGLPIRPVRLKEQ